MKIEQKEFVWSVFQIKGSSIFKDIRWREAKCIRGTVRIVAGASVSFLKHSLSFDLFWAPCQIARGCGGGR